MRCAVAVLVTIVVLAGCGKSGGGRLSKSEFEQKADAICAGYERKVAAVFAGVKAGNTAQLTAAIDKSLPLIKKGNDELSRLKPPKGLDRTYARWLRKSRTEESSARDLRDAIKGKDLAAVRRILGRLTAFERDQNRVARTELGLKTCARGASP
ncbi:MAG: hypothetical protein WBB74_02705 [Gaiellaceae bacterium]